MKKLTLIAITFLAFFNCFSQAPDIDWEKIIGGEDSDFAYSIIQTSDNNYLFVGTFENLNVVKLDIDGNILWSESFPGYCNGGDNTILETDEGNYIVMSCYESDFLMIKISSTGNLIWTKQYGGSVIDIPNSICKSYDGGYVVAGTSNSMDGDLTGNYGDYDIWVIKTDSLGNRVWQKNYGGSNIEQAYSIIQTSDSCYIVGGYSNSSDIDISVNNGGMDICLFKIDTLGNILWQKSYGGSDDDRAYSICKLNSSEYVIGGTTNSVDGDVTSYFGDMDVWIIKIDSVGNILWQRNYGGSSYEKVNSVISTSDGNIVFAGSSDSYDGQVYGVTGGPSIWVVKLSSLGDTLWTKTCGGSEYDRAESIKETNDGGLIISGFTSSFPISGMYYDYWIIKLLPESNIVNENENELEINVFPNPSSGFVEIVSEDILKVDVLSNCGEIIRVYGKSNKFDLSDLPQGLYIMRIFTKTGLITKQIVKI